jgi:hypothetical protein
MSHAEPLLAQLIRDGKIEGMSVCDLVRAYHVQEVTGLPARLKLPIRMCDRCATQLLAHWYAINPVTDLEIVCRYCAIWADAHADVEIYPLVGGPL